MAVEKNQVQELHEMISDMKQELDKFRAEKRAAEMMKKAEEEAEARAKRLAEAEAKESETIKDIVEKLTAEKLEKIRSEKKIEFPVGLRAGNLSKADKQLLDVIKGTKTLKYDGAKSVITTTVGAEWNPTELANEIIRAKEALVRVRTSGIRVINMPSNPFKVPVRTGPADVSAPGEGAAIAENTTDFIDNVTLTASKLAANVPVSTEEGEDAIIAVLPEIRAAIAEGLAKNEEEFFLNGTINGGMAVSGTGIIGGAGVTKEAGSANTSATAATQQEFDTALSDALKAMGVYGIDPAELLFFVGINTYYDYLYNNPNIQQISQYGSNAVLVSGEVGRYKGMPILVTSGVRKIADGGENTTSSESNLIVNKRSVLLGDRRTLTIKSQDYIDQDITKLVGTQRIAYAVPAGLNAGVAVVKVHMA
ncbi:phage major capsid protein [Thermoactinomyces daqus]|uniref:Phage major capsid protein n=1 Tax=Thermoactinomyces daqus TaxID=1329516 RepID=A0A7W1X8E6_9BACL|nr:phage major capsid protein [Thermoactinomyces daqus]MBA4541973.1 phage major capsid protein [Thermoactinomyces daqus]